MVILELIMSQQGEQPVNIKATAWTAGVHIVLILLFFLISYTVPATQPIQEMGMEVNLGTSDDGSGTDQPMAIDDPAPDAANAAYTSNAQQANNSREMMQTDDPDAPAVAPVTTNNNNRNNTEANNNRTRSNNRQATNNAAQQQQRPRYVYNGGTGTGGNSANTDLPGSSEGNTTGNGDRGVPGGTAGAPNYTGVPGAGNGSISYHMIGRSIISRPPPDAEFKEGGRVVVRITVNRDGTIIDKKIQTASNAELSAIALKKVDKIKFNKAANAPIEQFGSITFVFKTRS